MPQLIKLSDLHKFNLPAITSKNGEDALIDSKAISILIRKKKYDPVLLWSLFNELKLRQRYNLLLECIENYYNVPNIIL